MNGISGNYEKCVKKFDQAKVRLYMLPLCVFYSAPRPKTISFIEFIFISCLVKIIL